jgi:hypothetical protein
MRVAWVRDWLTGMRGGERVLDELAAALTAAGRPCGGGLDE